MDIRLPWTSSRFAASLLFLLPVVGLCAPQGTEPSTPKILSADTQTSTPNGASFIAPAGWSISNAPAFVLLQPPEKDSRVAVVDIEASDAASAVKAAWQLVSPKFKRPLQVTTAQPARDGWEERQIFVYETSPNERAVVLADARRTVDRWVVTVVDATAPTMEKRGSQMALLRSSLRPKGYERESFVGRTAAVLNSERMEQLRQFVQSSMETLGIPGVSMALIDGGKVVFEGGFGVRELGKPEPVDANTVFMAASNTKGMTTLLLASLADEKRLAWDQRVTELYSKFKLGDQKTTSQVLVKHLICACTGLPRQDMEWLFEYADATPLSSLALLGTMQPTSAFGELYQYSNLMASAAGYVGAHLDNPEAELGAGYDEAMRKRIFGPLGMNSTIFDFEQAQKGNHARPHSQDVDGNTVMSGMGFNYAVIPHRPAGGVWTSAHDLIRYVQLELKSGRLPDGKVLVSEKNLLARRQPLVPAGEDRNYGMGLMTNTTWGIPIVSHGGSLSGYKSDIMFLPDHGVGAVLLTNADNGGLLLGPFMRRLFEVLFDGKPEAIEDVKSRAANQKAFQAKFREKLVIPPDPQQVSKLASRYTSAALGEIAVMRQQGRTVFDFGEWNSTVASRKNDDGTLSFITTNAGRIGFEFVVGERNRKRVLVLRDAQHEYVFTEAS